MILEQGETIHVIIRRNFEGDLRRHFIGKVSAVSGTLVRAEGYVFVLDTGTNRYIRRAGTRTRILGLADAGNIVNILPRAASLDDVQYTQSEEGRLIVTDGKTFTLDINEFGPVQ